MEPENHLLYDIVFQTSICGFHVNFPGNTCTQRTYDCGSTKITVAQKSPHNFGPYLLLKSFILRVQSFLNHSHYRYHSSCEIWMREIAFVWLKHTLSTWNCWKKDNPIKLNYLFLGNPLKQSLAPEKGNSLPTAPKKAMDFFDIS